MQYLLCEKDVFTTTTSGKRSDDLVIGVVLDARDEADAARQLELDVRPNGNGPTYYFKSRKVALVAIASLRTPEDVTANSPPALMLSMRSFSNTRAS
jgi:hypothetical protein